MFEYPLLIVEDEPDGQELISRMLEVANVPVEVAGDAETAWQMLEKNPYCMAVIDLALPGMSGNALLRRVRATPELAFLPCIAITAYHTPELKRQSLEEGFDAYFAKPLDRTLLVGAVQNMLAG